MFGRPGLDSRKMIEETDLDQIVETAKPVRISGLVDVNQTAETDIETLNPRILHRT